jgi:uncharacterized protein (TIGR03067 family)
MRKKFLRVNYWVAFATRFCIEGGAPMRLLFVAMAVFLVSATGVVLFHGGEAIEEVKVKSELEGTWKLVELVTDGTEEDPKVLEGVSLKINANQIEIRSSRFWIDNDLTYEINAAKNPKEIDFTVTGDGPNKGRKTKGIYKKESDMEYVLCLPVDLDGDRPTSWICKAGSNHVLYRLQKAK